MSQMNINVTPEFIKNLRDYMRRRGIKLKAVAVREAVREAVAAIKQSEQPKGDFLNLLGAGLKSPVNERPRFRSEDDLWIA